MAKFLQFAAWKTGVWAEGWSSPGFRVFHVAGFKLHCQVLLHVEVLMVLQAFKGHGAGLGARPLFIWGVGCREPPLHFHKGKILFARMFYRIKILFLLIALD